MSNMSFNLKKKIL